MEDNDDIVQTIEEEITAKEKASVKKTLSIIGEYGLCILIAVIIALFLRRFVIVLGYVPSSSMYDTIEQGDRVTIFRMAYLFDDPKRGDIVSFYDPDDESQIFIKRIIGLPGETIEGKDGMVYIDGVALSEPYTDGAYTYDFGPYEVPEGYYFMMGDNRGNSLDSRFWTNKFVGRDKIIGKSTLKVYPKIMKLEKAVYE